MKRYLLLICSIMFVFLLSSCNNANNSSLNKSPTDKFTIVTSFYPMYIFTRNLTKDIPNVEVINMTKETTGCLHDYQMSPLDIKTLENANLLVINGAGMESFIDKVTSQLPNLKILDTSKGIKLIKNEYTQKTPTKQNDRLIYNPHIFVSITNAIKQSNTIADNLIQLDPKNKSYYANNRKIYVGKLDALRTKMHAELDKYKGTKIITFHEAFPYFASEFGLKIAAVIEREPGSEPSARELSNTIDMVNSTGIKALFAEPQYPTRSAEVISNETGAKVYILDPVVTGDINNIDTYTLKMEQNLKTLKEALAND